jgi:hypothetical protein
MSSRPIRHSGTSLSATIRATASVAATSSAADFFATQIDLTKRAKQVFDAEGISVLAPPPEAPRQEASATRQ